VYSLVGGGDSDGEQTLEADFVPSIQDANKTDRGIHIDLSSDVQEI